MWPFQKASLLPKPQRWLADDVVAHYNRTLKFWSFHYRGIEFCASAPVLPDDILRRAVESLGMVRRMECELLSNAKKELRAYECNASKACVTVVDLGECDDSSSIEVSITGDETWGDLAVNVVIEEGLIIDVFATD